MADYSHRELAAYDDIGSGYILDTVLGFRTHKMGVHWQPLPHDAAAVRALLRRVQRGRMSVAAAYAALSKQTWLQTILRRVRSTQRPALAAHLQRYIAIFRPDSGFCICKSDRYSSTTHAEAQVSATRRW